MQQSRALNLALRDELVAHNAAQGLDLPNYTRRPVKLWTPEQLARFFEATKDHRWHAAFLISAICGLRRGEVIGLQWRDIDFADRVIHVRRQR